MPAFSMPAAAMSAATMPAFSMSAAAVAAAAMPAFSMSAAAASISVIATAVAISVIATAAVRPMTVFGLIAAATAVASATTISEAIAPAGPGANAQEDAVVEVPRAVKARGRAAIGRIFVIAILANRGRTAEADTD